MPAHSMPVSPVAGPNREVDESQLPQGNCRYIMLLPELKGARCACVHFTLNKALPGATCECGHLACFHHRIVEPSIDKHEVDLLRQRVQQLEDLLAKGSDRENEVVQRISELEGVMESRTEEISQEIKKTYGNLNRAWNSIGELERRTTDHEHRLKGTTQHLKNVDNDLERLHHRQCELNDADLSLEERFLELAETVEDAAEEASMRGWRRRKSISDPTPSMSRHPDEVFARPRQTSTYTPQRAIIPSAVDTPTTPLRSALAPLPSSSTVASEVWTVHVSLLPTSALPFPFERHTNAYKRCLSRGLHQMVAVNGTSSSAFVSAVSRAFASLLRGRPWEPLQAKICDAETLQGLPMLRPLDAHLASAGRFDVEFLRAHHCAVLDAGGKIDSLYIAMQRSTLSWHALRRAPVFLQGLEASWEYDPMLDAGDPFDQDDEDVSETDRPSAGDLVGSFPGGQSQGQGGKLKRAASELSRSTSFGAGDGERPTKMSRAPGSLQVPCETRRQRVWTA